MKNIESVATILHVDMDAFYASVAERDNPKLKGKALVVGAGRRGVVTSANYEARKFGIRAAMPVYKAKALAPHAIFVAPDMARYSEVSKNVMQIFDEVTPLVEPISLDEAFLDVTGSKRLFGTGRQIADFIRNRVQQQEGITCSVGKIWGVGPKTNEQLMKMGLLTVGDIANTPRGTLIRVLGEAAGSSLYELAWGRDYRDVEIEHVEKSISAAETFDIDLDVQEEILKEFLRLTERSVERMRERGFATNTISIKVRFADFKTISRSKTVDLPITGTQEIFEVVKNLYLGLKLDRALIRLVGVSLDGLVEDEQIKQLALGERASGWQQADQAVDRIKSRFGRGSLRPARLVQDHEEE